MVMDATHFNKAALISMVAALAGIPAFGQVDLAGNWISLQHEDWVERSPGPDPNDYTGYPVNDEARAMGLSYSSSSYSLPERECNLYPQHYILIAPMGFKIHPEEDPVTNRTRAWIVNGSLSRAPMTIWMDGRPHPSKNAAHTVDGFTTGFWDGNTLTTYTTHNLAGYYRRNGMPSSDEATMTMHFDRHGDYLTVTALMEDPIYFSEPFILSRTYHSEPGTALALQQAPCYPEAEVTNPKGDGYVPHYLPGKNPFVGEVTQRYHIPLETVLGGAETMYPEYRKKLKDQYVAPEKCVRYCCGWGGGEGTTTAGLHCITGGSGQ